MISVVIPAYNEERFIARCLSCLAAQRTQQPFEVIVVDNASTDATAAIARTFSPRLRLRVIEEQRVGRGVARQTGFRQARGSIILSTDADAEPHPEWIDDLVRVLLKRPTTVAVTGTYHINDCGRAMNGILNRLIRWQFHLFRIFFGYYSVAAANFAVRRTAYRRSGGFDAQYDACEDTDLSQKLQALGKIRWSPTSVLVSGRRFKGRPVRGVLEYLSPFVQKMFLGRKHLSITNVGHS